MLHLPHIQLPFFAILLIIIVLAKFLGEIMERLGQPSMIGEILAGIIVGPALLNIVNNSNDLKIFSDLGVFLIIILAGYEINIEDLHHSIRGKNTWIAILAFIFPFFSGLIVGYFFHFNFMLTLFLGLCISITALPVSIRILMDLGKLNSMIGQKIISIAMFKDVVAILILGIILDSKAHTFQKSEFAVSIGLIILKFVSFIAIILISYFLIKLGTKELLSRNRHLDYFLKYMKAKESMFAIVMIFVLLFASISELLGLHFIIGAFFGTILLSKEMIGKEQLDHIKKSTSAITMSFLAPIFFALIGIELNFFSINNFNLLFVVLAVSFIAPILGGYAGARIAGLNPLQSVTLGTGLNARGIMELIIANIALQNNFIDKSIFSILVIMGIITTIASPVFLKYLFKKLDQKEKSEVKIDVY